MISKRLSSISSSEELFNEIKHDYSAALETSGYNEPISYTGTPLPKTKKKRTRTRSVIWFNPPFSANVLTDVGRKFFNLLGKHFPKEHDLHKIINRNTVKLSYSCMPNMKRIIKNHNKSVLLATEHQQDARQCNCRDSTTCPLQGRCLNDCNTYEADVETIDGEIYPYIGISDGPFKHRWYDHMLSFRNRKYENKTEISKLIWKLKDKNIQYTIKWKILEKCTSYRAGSKRCNLCLSEKLHILKNPRCIITKKQKSYLSVGIDANS